jgi:hypothetical protein
LAAWSVDGRISDRDECMICDWLRTGPYLRGFKVASDMRRE